MFSRIKDLYEGNSWLRNCNLDMSSFWKEIKLINSNSVLLPNSTDEAVRKHDIIVFWKLYGYLQLLKWIKVLKL